MEEKKSLKISIILTILGVVVVATGLSFAIFSQIINSTKQQTIKSGIISFQLSEATQGIELNNLQEMNNYDGLAQDTYYEFTLKNNGDTLTDYSIYLVDDTVPTSYTNTLLDDKYIMAGLEVNGEEMEPVNLETVNRLIQKNTIGVNKTYNYKLRLWLNFDGLTETEKESLIGQTLFLKIKISGTQVLEFPNLDTSGANKPELASNMIPVYYDSTNDVWKKADSSNVNSTYQWYSYESSGDKKGMWANTVTVSEANRKTYKNAALGTTIPMDDINTMFVWIPRFSAVTPSNYNGGTQEAPGAINVTFVDTTNDAIDAFTFGTESLSGFWYGKFETSHSSLASSTTNNNLGCTTETCSNANGIIIKPNVTSLRYNDISNFFYASRSMEQTNNSFGFVSSEVDTHMSKNNEWGAVVYLTQSMYGRCTSSTSCSEVTINDNSSYITGSGDYKTNINQSTTGTIYGIYDMSGGAFEYVMGNYNNTIGSSGFSSMPESKYYNSYSETTYTGHALTETSGWYKDAAVFIEIDNPWFARGGGYGVTYFSGIFSYFSAYCTGAASGDRTLHIVVSFN